MGTFTAQLLVGHDHRYGGGIIPSWPTIYRKIVGQLGYWIQLIFLMKEQRNIMVL